MKLPCFKYGFTLIELLIVISLIAIVTGAIVPSFSGYINKQGTIQAGEQIRSDLRSLQNRALSGDSSDETISGSRATYWGIEFNGSNSYSIFITSASSSEVASASSCSAINSKKVVKNTQKLAPNLLVGATGCLLVDFSYGDFTVLDGSGSGINAEGSNYYFLLSNSKPNSGIIRTYFNETGLLWSQWNQ